MTKNIKTRLVSFLPVFVPCVLAFITLIFTIYSGQKVLEEKLDVLNKEVKQANLGGLRQEIKNNVEQIKENKSRIVRLENHEFVIK